MKLFAAALCAIGLLAAVSGDPMSTAASAGGGPTPIDADSRPAGAIADA